MNIYGILLISYICCLILNPILYFVVWELYKRPEWIDQKTRWHSDERFWKLNHKTNDFEQVAKVRPQVKDVVAEFDSYWCWWMPLVNIIYAIVMSIRIIAKPFDSFLKYMIRKIANLKV